MQARWRLINLYCNSIHATALATFAETVGGLALMTNLKSKDRAILGSINVKVRMPWKSIC
jgi:acyl-coenzyme A thioesterase PaaI-like protein